MARRARDPKTLPLEVQAERLSMALAEAGYPGRVRVIRAKKSVAVKFYGDRFKTDREGCAAAWARAAVLVGRRAPCVPCLVAQGVGAKPRVSPDCEGTGRCAT
jgi:hypothetical protein